MRGMMVGRKEFHIMTAVLLALGLLVMGACTSPTTNAPTPTLSITSPANGASVPQGDITVKAQTTNFNVVDKQGKANVAGEGHLHFYLDVDAPMTAGKPAVPASGVWAHVSSTSYTFTGVAAGTHTISVQLVNNDHTPVIPVVVAKITITVTAPTAAAPALSITSPADGASVPQGDIKVNVQATNFNVVDKQGQANIAGEGHLHFYLDVDAPTTAGKPAIPTASGAVWAHVSGTSYTFTNVAAGTHTISVQLVNNDHTPLATPVVAKITITVTAPTAAAPALSITSPADGASVPAGNITVNAQVTNFNVVDKQGKANVAGEGHLHFYLDVDAPTTAGQPAIPASGSIWAHVSGTSYTFTNVAAGTHTISVELINNDHTPLATPVVAKITITATATTAVPTLSITSPTDGASVPPGIITVNARVTNFNVVDKQGLPNVAGEGHLHFYLDVDAPTTAGQPAIPTAYTAVWAHVSGTSYTFTAVAAGTHTISVQLVNNDHTPVIPIVVAKITVTVTAASGGGGGY